MLIQLTNATETFNGQPILLNTDMILSAYRSVRVDKPESGEEVTYIYMPPQGNWEVQETPEEIMKLLKKKA